MDEDEQTKTYTGDVILQKFGRGSKSERNAVTLSTRYGDFVMRLPDSHSFVDRELEDLVGKRIRASGLRHRHVFIVKDWSEVGVGKRSRSRKKP